MTPPADAPAPKTERRWTESIRVIANGYHLWTGTIHDTGYGSFMENGKRHGAHRFAYERANGPIPKGLQIDHLCRNRACVNPEHLRAVTSRENTLAPGSLALAALNSVKTACVNGHDYTPNNTVIRPVDGYRYCRECNIRRMRARRKAARHA